MQVGSQVQEIEFEREMESDPPQSQEFVRMNNMALSEGKFLASQVCSKGSCERVCGGGVP